MLHVVFLAKSGGIVVFSCCCWRKWKSSIGEFSLFMFAFFSVDFHSIRSHICWWGWTHSFFSLFRSLFRFLPVFKVASVRRWKCAEIRVKMTFDFVLRWRNMTINYLQVFSYFLLFSCSWIWLVADHLKPVVAAGQIVHASPVKVGDVDGDSGNH